MPPALFPVVVTKTRSPHTTGDEWPLPGSSYFQLRSPGPILVGTVLAWLKPEPFGPRKRVHSWATSGRVSSGNTVMAKVAADLNSGVLARLVFSGTGGR